MEKALGEPGQEEGGGGEKGEEEEGLEWFREKNWNHLLLKSQSECVHPLVHTHAKVLLGFSQIKHELRLKFGEKASQ